MTGDRATGPVLVLVGSPGSGKTTVGQLLGDRLGVPFRDTDRDVETIAGSSISEIFLDRGEEAFRELECTAVRTALAEHLGVLAVGGGAVLATETRALLRHHRVVWLEVALPDAAKRVGLARDRPLLLGNPRAELFRLLEERRPLYTEIAGRTVVTDGRSPDEVADAVLHDFEPAGPE